MTTDADSQADPIPEWEYSVRELSDLTGRSPALINYYIRAGILKARKVDEGYRGHSEYRIDVLHAIEPLRKLGARRTGPKRAPRFLKGDARRQALDLDPEDPAEPRP